MSRFIISNGDFYIGIKDDSVSKVNDISEAKLFANWSKCKNVIRETSFCDEEWFYQEAYLQEHDGDPGTTCVVVTGKQFHPTQLNPIKRYGFSKDIRKIVYEKSKGSCKLCGRKIAYEDMAIDHIIPIALNGTSHVENLQCACEFCNSAKASVLPEDFFKRISGIFMYQMEQKHGGKLIWKLIKKVLKMKYSL